MAQIIFSKGDVFEDEKGDIGVVFDDMFALSIIKQGRSGYKIFTESHPKEMTPVMDSKIERLPYEIQIAINAIRSTIALIR